MTVFKTIVAPVSVLIRELWFRRDSKGNSSALDKVMSQYLSTGTDEKRCKTSFVVADAPIEVWGRHLPNKYRCRDRIYLLCTTEVIAAILKNVLDIWVLWKMGDVLTTWVSRLRYLYILYSLSYWRHWEQTTKNWKNNLILSVAKGAVLSKTVSVMILPQHPQSGAYSLKHATGTS